MRGRERPRHPSGMEYRSLLAVQVAIDRGRRRWHRAARSALPAVGLEHYWTVPRKREKRDLNSGTLAPAAQLPEAPGKRIDTPGIFL